MHVLRFIVRAIKINLNMNIFHDFSVCTILFILSDKSHWINQFLVNTALVF